MSDATVVLAVDLDGTLLQSDLLHENIAHHATRHPGMLAAAVAGLSRGKAVFKARLAEQYEPDVATLPYRQEVLDLIQQARAAGRAVVLVSASDQRLLDRIAGHLKCFDAAYGSDGSRNLSGENKARFLVDRYGAGNYDYVGDAAVDLPVWRGARLAITVGAGASLRARVDAAAARTLHIDTGPAPLRAYLKALRPHQWMKNVLVFLPLLASHRISMADLLATALVFVAFCLTASAVYVVNDILDIPSDRIHPRKRRRPFASGAIPISHGAVMVAVLAAATVVLSIVWLQPLVVLALLGYCVLTTAYSISLKRKMVVDICTLAGLYTLRIITGAAATSLPLSPWLLALSVFLFFSLAAIKRQAELLSSRTAGVEKLSGRNYEVGDIPVIMAMSLASGYNAVLVLALYINSDTVAELYSSPFLLWLICPVLLYWVSRLVLLTQRGMMDDDPVLFAVRDHISLACGAVILAIALAASLL